MSLEEQMKAKALMEFTANTPIIAASLLNATYSYLTWRKPLDFDDKTFEEAFLLIQSQWKSVQSQMIVQASKTLGQK